MKRAYEIILMAGAVMVLASGCGKVQFFGHDLNGDGGTVTNITDASPSPSPDQFPSPSPSPNSSASPSASPNPSASASPNPSASPSPSPVDYDNLGICKLLKSQIPGIPSVQDRDDKDDHDDADDDDDSSGSNSHKYCHKNKDDDDDDDTQMNYTRSRVGFRNVSDAEFSRANGSGKACDDNDRDDDTCRDSVGKYLAPVHGKHNTVCMTETACDVYINSYLNTTGGVLLAKPGVPHDKTTKYTKFKKMEWCQRPSTGHPNYYRFSNDRVQSELSRLMDYWSKH